MCRTVRRPDILAYCEKLLRLIGWRAYCEIELIADPRDGLPKVMEINGRASASIKICTLAGANVAQQMIQLGYGEPVQVFEAVRQDVRMRCIHTDLLWLLNAPDRFSRKPSWFSCVRTHDQIFSLRDPLPFFTFSLQSLAKYKQEIRKRKRD